MSVDLNNLKDKCRLCFQRTGSARKSAIIDKEIQEKFLNYTNVEVIFCDSMSSLLTFKRCSLILANNVEQLLKFRVQTMPDNTECAHKVQRKHDCQPKKTLFES